MLSPIHKQRLTAFFACCLLMGCSDQSHQKKLAKPNIIVIMTDQERYPTHWPEDWAADNLNSTERLKAHGLTFTRAYTAACECSPSRAVMQSGEHFPANNVDRTPPPFAGLPSNKQHKNIGAVLNEAGYDVVWKGKWHLSWPIDKVNNWSEQDVAALYNNYGLTGWNPPDAGNAIMEIQPTPWKISYSGLSTLGGGYADNDGRFTSGISEDNPVQVQGFGESVLEYLKKMADTKSSKPFCLFVSLVNPHDIWVYPTAWENAGYSLEDLGIELPSNYSDDLSTKPSIQRKAKEAYNRASPIATEQEAKGYVNFYAALHKNVDKHIEAILDALEEHGLFENTVIIRTADHGELGMSHGMREKSYTAYEEMIHIPLIISNPGLFPEAQTTDSFYCHLDLLPTLAELAGNPQPQAKGVSMVPVIKDPSVSVQDSILYTYDDVFFLPKDEPRGHIRAIRQGDWLYAVYYSLTGDHFEYEMYNLRNDPGELHNLLYADVSEEYRKIAHQLHEKLLSKIEHAGALQDGVHLPRLSKE